MSYYSDNAIAHADTGVGAIVRASTFEDYIQTPVWQECSMPLNIHDALKEYFDETTGEMRFSVQGTIDVYAASTIPFAAGSDPTPLGNIYLEYEFDFQDPALDRQIVLVHTQFSTLSNITTPVGSRDAVVVTPGQGTPTAATVGMTWVSSIPLSDAPNWVASCVISTVTLGGVSPWQGNWLDFPEFEDVYPVPGQVFFMRFIEEPIAAGVAGLCFADVDSASTFTYNPQSPVGSQTVTPGQLVHQLGSTTTGGSMLISMRLWRLGV
jgi:hypothetical protein